MLRRICAIATLVFAARAAVAETITTQSGLFRVHYSEGASETAKRTAVIAEDVYYQLVTAYSLHEKFRTIDILVTDDIDAGNGFADYYQNQLVVWATNLDWELRGTHNWLRNVVTHELGHIFSLKLAKRYPFRYGLISANVLNSSVADLGVGLPIYSLVTPAWWVEGIAQYEANQYGSDRWDTHRDMLLRMATLENDLLSYDDMGVFAHNWLKSEMVYNQGYSLTLDIGRRYGVDVPRHLAKRTGYITFNTALRENLGTSGNQLYEQWAAHLRTQYTAIRDSVGPVVEGTILADEGSYETAPAISPDGTRIAYTSARREDFLLTKPRIRHLGLGSTSEVDEDVRGPVAWFPDGSRMVYAKFGRGTGYNDLYVYDIAKHEETRITTHLRAREPAVSPDGDWIAFVANEDGATRLGMARSDGSELRWLTNSRRSAGSSGGDLAAKTSGTIQFFTPRWSPDGTKLLFSVFRNDDRDIALIGTQGPYFTLRGALADSSAFPDTLVYARESGFRLLVHSTADERDPTWLPDGTGFIFSADYDIAAGCTLHVPHKETQPTDGSRPFGIFNLYRASLPGDSMQEMSFERLTNVLGGAFLPSVSPDASWLAYVGYHANNFSVYTLPLARPGNSVALTVRQYRAIPRDYQAIEKSPTASQLFRVTPTYGMRTLVGWIPILRFGPNLVGDRFSVNQVGLGLIAGIEEQGGSRFYYGSADISKNLAERDPAYTSVLLYAEQGLRPLLTTESRFSPSFYGYAARQEIGVVTEQREVSEGGVSGSITGPNDEVIPLSAASVIRLSNSAVYWDNFRYLIGGAGIRTGVGRRQAAAAEFTWQRYRMEESVDRRIDNYSMVLDDRNPARDVTALVPWGDLGAPAPGTPTIIWDKLPKFSMAYFHDKAATFRWSYGSITPTVDGAVNPTGGRVITASYTFHDVSLSDSLAGVNADGNYDQIDPTQPLFSPVNRRFSANEVVLSYQEFIRLPGFLRRTTFAFLGVAAYFDHPLKYFDPNDDRLGYFEGWAYWPLRYRLGGGGTLRGYPYFSHEGSKMAFFRASYVFPIIAHYGTQLQSFYHDRTYGALFAESGSTWNWGRLKDAWIAREDFLWDIGVEIRMSGRMFHYMPVAGYAAIARRMTDVPYPFADYGYTNTGAIVTTQPDRYRIYLGASLSLGGDAGNHVHSAPHMIRSPDLLISTNPARRAETGLWGDVVAPVAPELPRDF